MVATISMGQVPLVMVISISNTEELYYSTNRTTMVATLVLTIVPIEVGLCSLEFVLFRVALSYGKALRLAEFPKHRVPGCRHFSNKGDIHIANQDDLST